MPFLARLLLQISKGKVHLSRRGQTLVEYSLVLCMVSILSIAVFSALGKQIITIFSSITTLLDTAQSSH